MNLDNPSLDSDDAFIDLAYRLVLQRPVDEDGRSHYKEALASGLPPFELLRVLLNSEEYKQRTAAYDYITDPEIAPQLTPALREFSARLQACREVERASYEQAWSEIFSDGDDLIIGQRSYGEIHKTRFWELINAVSLLIDDVGDGTSGPRVLEIG